MDFPIPARWFLLITGLIFISIFILFYPPFYIGIDEHEYIKNAFLLRNGSLKTDDPLLYCGGIQTPTGESISSYPIGKSILLIPFTFLPFAGIFIFGLITHLLNLLLLGGILRQQAIDIRWAALYLFIPIFQWSSRTLYPELSVLTLFLAAYFFWGWKRPTAPFISGLLLGISLFVRYDAIIGIAGFGLHSLFADRKRFLPLILGFIPPFLLLFGFNHFTYGDIFSTGYGAIGEQFQLMIPSDFWINLFTYGVLLALVIPFSYWGAIRHPHKILFLTMAAGYIVFFSYFTPFWHFSFSWPLTFTARLRYFIPVLGMLLIPTLTWYHGILGRYFFRISGTHRKWVATILLFVIIGGSMALHSSHQQLSEPRAEVSEIILNNIPVQSHVIGSADDCIYFLPEYFGKYFYHQAKIDSSFINPDTGYYILDIAYLTQIKNDSTRQDVINRERGVIKAFISENRDRLIQVYSSSENARVTIWRVA